jgi:hypothetical protein
VSGGGQLALGDRPHHQSVDREHWRAVRVHGGDLDRVLASGYQPDPHRVGSGAMQPDPGPRHRQPGLAWPLEHAERMQAGVHEGGVHGVPVDVGPLWKFDLRVQGVSGAPGRPQALEGRPVVDAGRCQRPVRLLRVERDGVARRPVQSAVQLVVLPVVLFVVRGGHHGSGVVHPGGCRLVRLDRRPGVDGDRPAALRVGRAHGHLEGYVVALGQDQRPTQRQLPHPIAADGRAAVQHQLQEGGAGQQHRAVHRVIGQPRLLRETESAGVHRARVAS